MWWACSWGAVLHQCNVRLVQSGLMPWIVGRAVCTIRSMTSFAWLNIQNQHRGSTDKAAAWLLLCHAWEILWGTYASLCIHADMLIGLCLHPYPDTFPSGPRILTNMTSVYGICNNSWQSSCQDLFAFHEPWHIVPVRQGCIHGDAGVGADWPGRIPPPAGVQLSSAAWRCLASSTSSKQAHPSPTHTCSVHHHCFSKSWHKAQDSAVMVVRSHGACCLMTLSICSSPGPWPPVHLAKIACYSAWNWLLQLRNFSLSCYTQHSGGQPSEHSWNYAANDPVLQIRSAMLCGRV